MKLFKRKQQEVNSSDIISEVLKLSAKCLLDEITAREYALRITENYNITRKPK